MYRRAPQGKEDCVRKAYRGVDILPDLQRTCPALSLQQVGRVHSASVIDVHAFRVTALL